MPVQVKNTSALVYGELKSIDGIEFWDMLDLPIYTPQPNDIAYTTQNGDRLDSLASTYYGDPVALWVLAWANNMDLYDPTLQPNIALIIPDPNYVKTKLFRGLVISRL